MNLKERFKDPVLRGEFELIAKNREGSVVYEHVDHNVVVNDARVVTAFLVSQAILSGADRQETIDDADTYFDESLIGAKNVQISFM